MSDVTYVKAEITQNSIWELAFSLSEIMNDDAPIGWSKYIPTAKCLLDNYEIRRKEGK